MTHTTPIQLAGAVALVTGASRGIGPVLAEALARRGVNLVLAARNQGELQAVAEKLRAHGVRVVAVPTDLADRPQLHALVARAVLELGRIDILVNNAGLEQICRFDRLSESDADQFIEVNLSAPIQLSRLVLPGMLERGVGRIINIASVAGLGPAAFGETYGATKAGLLGFTRSLRASLKTLKSPVSVSAICPGFISDSGMFADLQAAHALKAPALLGTCTPDEVAAAVLRAIERDEPELIVAHRPLRLMFGSARCCHGSWSSSGSALVCMTCSSRQCCPPRPRHSCQRLHRGRKVRRDADGCSDEVDAPERGRLTCSSTCTIHDP
jgi:short-subunit dehydrogenase